MAHIVMELTAIGIYESETCSFCDRPFLRGELISAVEAEDGAKLGWFCKQCLDEWHADSNGNS